MGQRSFELVCEIEPPTRPDLRRVRHQIGVLTPVADSFLIPDNHLGRATVSSIAVAHEVAAMGGRSIACVNSRDRNLLGFRRDLLTAAAYGVEELLFVYGDKPGSGDRTSELTVRYMIDQARGMADDPAFAGCPPFRVGVCAARRRPPAWKRAADFVFAQVSFSVDELLRWRDGSGLAVPVYAGVMVRPGPPGRRRGRLRAGGTAARQRRVRWCPPGAGRPLPRGRAAPGRAAAGEATAAVTPGSSATRAAARSSSASP